MERTQHTFETMRSAFVRARAGNRSVPPGAGLDRMIAIIDAMSAEERVLGNLPEFSRDRREELAAIAGVDVREVDCLIAGRRSLEVVARMTGGF